MLPFLYDSEELPFTNGDYLFVPNVLKAIQDKVDVVKAYVVKEDGFKEFELHLGELTEHERSIILEGCLINYNRANR